MDLVLSALDFLLFLFLIVVLARLVLEWVQMFARDWHPKGPVLVLAESVYTVTDPPLRAIRKVVPTIRIGGVGLDLSLLILLVLIWILRGPVISLLRGLV